MSAESSFKSIQDAVSACLIGTTRAAGQLASEDLAFHRSSNPSVAPLLDSQNARLLDLAQKLIRHATFGSDVSVSELPDLEAVEDNWKGIVDVVDNLLEKADACLDEYTGTIKKDGPPQSVQTSLETGSKGKKKDKSFRFMNLRKPQLLFNKVPTNNETTSFKPLLHTKPHAIVPLEDSIGPVLLEDSFEQYDTRFYLLLQNPNPALKQLIDSFFRYKHPYEVEINQAQYPPFVYSKTDPIPYLPLESTKATLVDTPEAVAAMLEELRSAQEIAVDLEHHDAHSYIGIVSLMQISTRTKDWIVDTLKPWREDLQILNEVFADPKILKVFHGAFMDMIWLQRDLGLYVIGLFDTYHASRALEYRRNNLGSLLLRFANFEAQKQYQLADWRIRPLPEELFDYARSDTHFLLFVYDNMRNELIENSNLAEPDGHLIDVVQSKSKQECLQRYERPFYDAERGEGSNGWYNVLLKTPVVLNKEQFAVFRAVHQWRDNLARQEDESIHTIMSKNVLLSISREMPMDKSSLFACFNPMSAEMRSHATELLEVIKEAQARGANGPDMNDIMKRPLANDQASTGDISQHNHKTVFRSENEVVLQPLQHGLTDASFRTNVSKFWGGTVREKSLKQTDHQISAHQNLEIRLAIPLPQLTAEIMYDDLNANESEVNASLTTPSASAEHQYRKDRKPAENNIFVIKELGGSKKRKPAELGGDHVARSSMPINDEEYSNGDFRAQENEVELAEEKARQKAMRKAQKRLEKSERQRREPEKRHSDGTKDGNAEEPFDYAKAPSVLHAKHDKTGPVGFQKSFDPYVKSMDAPKGMRKSKKEIPGRSHTFRS